jgi:hypothetical protein
VVPALRAGTAMLRAPAPHRGPGARGLGALCDAVAANVSPIAAPGSQVPISPVATGDPQWATCAPGVAIHILRARKVDALEAVAASMVAPHLSALAIGVDTSFDPRRAGLVGAGAVLRVARWEDRATCGAVQPPFAGQLFSATGSKSARLPA